MRSWLITIGLATAACASTRADANHAVNNGITCSDVILDDQSTTGGLPVTFGWFPCWNPSGEVAEHRGYVGVTNEVPTQPAPTSELQDAVTDACEKVAPDERDLSPFARGREISQVLPIHDPSGEPKGVKVVFKPGRGMTAEGVRDDIACQRARWRAVDQDPRLAPHDPTLVEGAHVSVAERDGRVEVTVTTERPEQAELAAARAAGALTPRPVQAARR